MSTFKTPSPRKRVKPIIPTIGELSQSYFDTPYTTVTNGLEKIMYKCRLCERHIIGTKKYNLGSHLESVHRDIYYSKIRPMKKEPLPVKRLHILLNAVEIVTVNGRPFNLLLDSGYQATIRNKLQKLRDAGMGIDFSNSKFPEVKKCLTDVAEKVRELIRKEVKNQTVSVLVDIATKNRRSIFGVAIQFIDAGELKIRTLGLFELTTNHTGLFLASELYEHLKSYGIEKRQLFTISRDNGANVVKMVNDFNAIDDSHATNIEEHRRNTCMASRSLFTDFDGIDETNVDSEIEKMLANVVTSEEALDILFYQEEIESNATLLESTSSEFIGNEEIADVTGISCACHDAQLGINYGLSRLNYRHSNVISLAREVTKVLARSTTSYEMKEVNIKYNLPRIDCKTRWGSTYRMVV